MYMYHVCEKICQVPIPKKFKILKIWIWINALLKENTNKCGFRLALSTLIESPLYFTL